MSFVRKGTLVGATVTAGLMAGLFYTYSISVMNGLSEQPDESFVATMQSINERIMNRGFFIVFFGVVVFMLATTIAHALRPRSLKFWLILAAAIFYMVGAFGVTVAVNVPLNDALASVNLDSSPEELATARENFENPWNLWNDVRSVSSLATFVLLVVACMMPDGQRLPEPTAK